MLVQPVFPSLRSSRVSSQHLNWEQALVLEEDWLFVSEDSFFPHLVPCEAVGEADSGLHWMCCRVKTAMF